MIDIPVALGAGMANWFPVWCFNSIKGFLTSAQLFIDILIPAVAIFSLLNRNL